MESNAITVNHHKMSSRIFATRLMLFCAGNVVDDDVTVNRIFLVNPVCRGLQSAVSVCSLRCAVCSLQSAVCKCHTPVDDMATENYVVGLRANPWEV